MDLRPSPRKSKRRTEGVNARSFGQLLPLEIKQVQGPSIASIRRQAASIQRSHGRLCLQGLESLEKELMELTDEEYLPLSHSSVQPPENAAQACGS
jgi:hypothetical protein